MGSPLEGGGKPYAAPAAFKSHSGSRHLPQWGRTSVVRMEQLTNRAACMQTGLEKRKQNGPVTQEAPAERRLDCFQPYENDGGPAGLRTRAEGSGRATWPGVPDHPRFACPGNFTIWAKTGPGRPCSHPLFATPRFGFRAKDFAGRPSPAAPENSGGQFLLIVSSSLPEPKVDWMFHWAVLVLRPYACRRRPGSATRMAFTAIWARTREAPPADARFCSLLQPPGNRTFSPPHNDDENIAAKKPTR